MLIVNQIYQFVVRYEVTLYYLFAYVYQKTFVLYSTGKPNGIGLITLHVRRYDVA